MKRFLLLLINSLVCSSAFAQIDMNDLTIIQNRFKKTKTELVKQNLVLSETQAQAFWPVYEAYEAKRMDLNKKRAAIINDYLKQYDTLTDPEAEGLANRTFENDASIASLQKTYYKKIAKSIGGKNAGKFYQLENYLQQVIRLDVQNNIPFIGEIDLTK